QELGINTFISNSLFIFGIFVVFIEIFFGFIFGQVIYNRNLKAIEINIRIGANKKQIIKSFVIEILTTALLPILFSTVISYLVFDIFTSRILIVQQKYHQFNVWFPVWLFFLLVILWVVALVGGWLLGTIPSLRSYTPTKQE
ncbi:MAG: FtsX-like permease family protein, partial [Candidatus Thorarchaeota archaeon]